MVESNRRLHGNITKNLQIDKLLAVIGGVVFTFAGIYLLAQVNQPLYGISSLLASLACLVYVPLKKHLNVTPQLYKNARYYDIAWIIIYCSTIACYYFRPEQYARPLVFFILIAISSGILAGKVIFCKLGKWGIFLSIIETMAIGLALEWSVMLMYPTVVGLDTWTHQEQTLQIVNGNYIEWYYFPVMHYMVAGVMEITGLSYKVAVMSISFIQVCGDALLVFLIGKKMMNYRAGLLAALIISFSSWHIFFGYWTIPNTLAVTFLLLVLYLVIKYNDSGNKWLIPLAILVETTLILTHVLTSAWLLAILGILFVIMIVKYHRINIGITSLIIILCGCVILAWWASGFLKYLMVLVGWGFNPEVIGLTIIPGSSEPLTTYGNTMATMGLATIPATSTIPSYIDTYAVTSWEIIFNALGMIIGFAIAICGSLWLLSRNNRTYLAILIISVFAFFLAGGVIPSLFGMSFIEHRWWYAGQIFGAILIASLIVAIRPLIGRIFGVVLIIVLSFLMIIGLPSNMDNDTFSKNQLVRYALTDGEINAMKYITVNYEGFVGVDAYYTCIVNLMPEYKEKIINISSNYLSGDFSDVGCDIILVRDAVAYEPFAYGGGHIYKLLYDPNIILLEDGYVRIYDAGGVKGYIK